MPIFQWFLLIVAGVVLVDALKDLYRQRRFRRLRDRLEPQLAALAEELSPRGFVLDLDLFLTQELRCICCGCVPQDPVVQQVYMPVGAKMHCLPFLVCTRCSNRVMEEMKAGRTDEMQRVEARIAELMEKKGWPPRSFVNDLPAALRDEVMQPLIGVSASGKAIYVDWLAHHTRECSCCGKPLDEASGPKVCLLSDHVVSAYGHRQTELMTPVLLCCECHGEDGPSEATGLRVAERVQEFEHAPLRRRQSGGVRSLETNLPIDRQAKDRHLCDGGFTFGHNRRSGRGLQQFGRGIYPFPLRVGSKVDVDGAPAW